MISLASRFWGWIFHRPSQQRLVLTLQLQGRIYQPLGMLPGAVKALVDMEYVKG